MVSHELRGHLSGVLSNLDLVRMTAEELGTEPTEHLEEAVDSGETMDDVMKDLLRYARSDKGNLHWSEFSLDTLTADVRDELGADLEATRADLQVEDSIRLAGDPSLLVRVVENLVENALAYAGDAPRIPVRGRESSHSWQVEVADDGPGIPRDEQADLFELFSRGPGTEEGEGTGLGRALCDRIVRRHGGKMGVDSTPGEGATFWFTIPKREPDA
jgi:signal transduction histidine kinase